MPPFPSPGTPAPPPAGPGPGRIRAPGPAGGRTWRCDTWRRSGSGMPYPWRHSASPPASPAAGASAPAPNPTSASTMTQRRRERLAACRFDPLSTAVLPCVLPIAESPRRPAGHRASTVGREYRERVFPGFVRTVKICCCGESATGLRRIPRTGRGACPRDEGGALALTPGDPPPEVHQHAGGGAPDVAVRVLERVVAAANPAAHAAVDPARRLVEEEGEGDLERVGDLERIQGQDESRADEPDDGGHAVAGHRLVSVEQAGELDVLAPEADLLRGLAQRGVDGPAVGVVEPPAGKLT